MTSSTLAANPLLNFDSLPGFDRFSPEHVAPAIQQLISEAAAALNHAKAPGTAATWQDVLEPLEIATERLGRAWGIVSHLNAVADEPTLRDAYTANLPVITEFWTSLSSDEALFTKYKTIAASPAFAQMSPARQQALRNAIRDFRLGGAELTGKDKERFAQLQEKLAQLGQQFSEHVLDATNDFSLTITDKSRLAGLPEDAIAAAAQEAAQDIARNASQDVVNSAPEVAPEVAPASAWKFTLRAPSYLPIMQYANDANLRETFYRANVTRASQLSSSSKAAALDNTALIDETLALKHEEALLLGFDNFAQVSLASKMAQSPEEVSKFLLDLAQRAKPHAQRDLAELKAFAKTELGMNDIKAWDTAWVSEKLKERNYSFSESQVKQYFQAPRVIEGMFSLIARLFNVQIKTDHAPVWHPDVLFYRIERQLNNQTVLVGQFYLDLFARATKRGGAWMDDARGRAVRGSRTQTPIAYLNCNFQAPVDGKPGLLTHDDVITLFHETGHGLHHLLTRVDDLAVSGINGVEWDAVELPSQFLENFAWDWEVIRTMSRHIDHGESLPRALFDKMVSAKNFQAGLQTLRQVEFALFDMTLHTKPFTAGTAQAKPGEVVQAILDQVRKEVAVIIPPAFNRFQNSFSHIFAGGYAAGYYSYKWAEVLSADCFAAFEETGGINPETGQKFLTEILSRGGSRPAIDSFRAFRGRDPEIAALLRHNGMTDSNPSGNSNHELLPA